jgi:membrane associated rhomboid family serine protease
MTEPNESDGKPALCEVGRYARLSDANERALVVLAMGFVYWMFREQGAYVLCVEEKNHASVARELDLFEEENRSWPRQLLREAGKTGSSIALHVFTMAMCFFFVVQQREPGWWLQRGACSGGSVFRDGEWWRVLTALTLHADAAHLLANVATGILFAAALIPLLGGGLAWTSIAFAGALGNLANAWLYRAEARESIGASTAVFGALGVLVAWQLVAILRGQDPISRGRMILPLGAGLGLLAYLGTSGERTDFMAHFFGFVAGNIIGALVGLLGLKERTPLWTQWLLAALVPSVFVLAWVLAAH